MKMKKRRNHCRWSRGELRIKKTEVGWPLQVAVAVTVTAVHREVAVEVTIVTQMKTSLALYHSQLYRLLLYCSMACFTIILAYCV